MKYEVWFKLVNEEKDDVTDFCDSKLKKVIEKAIDNFNTAGDVAKNKKFIYKKDIQKNIIKLQFDSDVELEKPTKSFRYFSKDLIDNSEEFADLVIGGRLLKGVLSREVVESSEESVETEMSDELMLQMLIHWCMSKEIQSVEEKKFKLETLKKIKNLMSECIEITK